MMQAHLLADFGRHSEAVAVLEQGIQFDRSIGLIPEQADKLIGLAYLYYRQKAFVESRTLALQATALDPSPRHLLEAGSLLTLMSDRAARKQLVRMRNDKELREIPLVKFAIAKLSQEIALTAHPAARELYFMRAMQTSLTDDSKLNASVKPGADEMARTLREVVDDRAHNLMYRDHDFPGLWSDALLALIGSGDHEACSDMKLFLGMRNGSDGAYAAESSRIRGLFQHSCTSK